MEEVWKDIPKFENFYQISNLGRIRLRWRNRHYSKSYDYKIIKGCYSSKNGYFSVFLRNLNGETRHETIHRLVAEVFIPNTEGKKYIDHIDTVRTNNKATNLRWVTAKENSLNPITRKKHSCSAFKTAKRGSENNNAVTVFQYDLNKNFIASFPSAIEASIKKGVSYRKLLHNIAGEQNQACGYIFSKEKF